MVELFKYATSNGPFTFLGCLILIVAIGWVLNAMVIGFKGQKPNDFF